MTTRLGQAQVRTFIVFLCLLLALASMFVSASGNLVRYINDEGNVVIDYTIPAKYVPRGYEIISVTGKVIETIAPEPTGEEIETQRELNRLRDAYAMLRKRYSNEKDILRVKERKLANVQASIALVESNIHSINLSIDLLIADAAKQERLGRDVSPETIAKLAEKRSELSAAEETLALRKQELLETGQKYDQDYQRFVDGKALMRTDLYNKTSNE